MSNRRDSQSRPPFSLFGTIGHVHHYLWLDIQNGKITSVAKHRKMRRNLRTSANFQKRSPSLSSREDHLTPHSTPDCASLSMPHVREACPKTTSIVRSPKLQDLISHHSFRHSMKYSAPTAVSSSSRGRPITRTARRTRYGRSSIAMVASSEVTDQCDTSSNISVSVR